MTDAQKVDKQGIEAINSQFALQFFYIQYMIEYLNKIM